MHSALKGSLWSNSARSVAWLIALRITKVPAAPTLTTSKSANSLARALGRNTLCPPTLTPLRNTTKATGFLQIPSDKTTEAQIFPFWKTELGHFASTMSALFCSRGYQKRSFMKSGQVEETLRSFSFKDVFL